MAEIAALRREAELMIDSAEHMAGFGGLVEAWLGATGVAPSRFGRVAASDPDFVRKVRAGRGTTLPIMRRVLGYIAGFDSEGLGGDPRAAQASEQADSSATPLAGAAAEANAGCVLNFRSTASH